MRLPSLANLEFEWPYDIETEWARLCERADKLSQKPGGGDVFNSMCERLRRSVARSDFDDIYRALEGRLGARALTWLWISEPGIRMRSCSPQIVDALVARQKPRLTRTTLLQVCKLYFQEFDRLNQLGDSTLTRIEDVVRSQVQKIPQTKRVTPLKDPVTALRENVSWILSLDGPAQFAQVVRESGKELENQFEELGLIGYDDGRYGELCRAHYYLNTLKKIPLGEWDPVFDELLKPAVNTAPYGENKRIGHAALEVLVDRAGTEVSAEWQKFVIGIAGDPRIHSSARNYQEWWKPLGEARVEKVRGWLSKEDLSLFLRALEQYGIESRNEELKRMFPARKRFLEGLYDQKLIRNTRLMLGRSAEGVVKRLLGDEIQTTFASLDGQLADKAIIYLNCGDFYIVEGSHNFRIWVYLAEPGTMVPSYEFSSFTHGDLTKTTPAQYKAMFDLPYEAVTHSNRWQSKVINFLCENGIELDIEPLFTEVEYRLHLSQFGAPVIAPSKVHVPAPKELPKNLQVRSRGVESNRSVFKPRVPNRVEDEKNRVNQFLRRKLVAAEARKKISNEAERRADDASDKFDHLSFKQKRILRSLAANPTFDSRYIANFLLQIPYKELSATLSGPLAPYVILQDDGSWTIKPEYIHHFK